MSVSPNYRFYRTPRFSVNHLTSYLSTTDAGQRDRIVQQAKFPKKVPVAAYGQARQAIQGFWGCDRAAADHFQTPLAKLEHQARSDLEKRDEALRCIAAIDRFQAIYGAKKWAGIKVSGGPVDLVFHREGMTINSRLDAQLFRTLRDETVTGGVVLFYASTSESRKNIDERRRQVASIIRWALENSGQMDPHPSLCLSIDIFGNTAIKAPDATDRFRSRVDTSCREAALKWDTIEPPAGYDGPEWR